ncbi:TRAP transporter small permease [Roseibium sp.]|uniref:TRAP transporter small permease n=1 Tax=Roseibium sp. TaxID=1936156 RepID=UPI003BA86A59
MRNVEPSNTDQAQLTGVLGTLDTVISRLESFMLAFGVLLMAANTVTNVVGRFVFQHSLFFSEELNRILIILITFAGISYAARQGRHIRMSAIFDMLPVPLRKLTMILIAVVTSLAMFALCYFAVRYIMSVAASGRVLPALAIPVYWIFLWVPVGFFMTGVQFALTALKNVFAKDIYLSTQVLEGYEDDEFEV